MSNVKDQELNKFRNHENKTVVATIDGSFDQIYLSIMNAPDRVKQITWLNFGTKDARLDTISYSSPSFGATIVRATFNYTLTNGQYRLDSESIAIV